ncbi:MAG: DNA methyltransferase, partial [Deltaproteobacteria bacterium]|nr:DNA methyltransferase [Deltaproteobacteria bacterium]
GKGFVPFTIWLSSEVGDTEESKKEILEIFSDETPFDTPKPANLVERIIHIAAKENSIILDSFAGSGTTAHAVLEANRKDGGNRRFILVECEDYTDTLTAERVRRVINGYTFTGNQRTELYREKITWSAFEKRREKILDRVESIERFEGVGYDKVKKEEKAPGLGGSFTFCTLGEPIEIESLLTGKGLPAYETLARYVFYTATGRSLETVAKPAGDGFIGETDLFRIHLFYQPDTAWLRSNEAALNADIVDIITINNDTGKRSIVFAVAKFMSQKELTKRRIEFCQLPYAIHRILGD